MEAIDLDFSEFLLSGYYLDRVRTSSKYVHVQVLLQHVSIFTVIEQYRCIALAM